MKMISNTDTLKFFHSITFFDYKKTGLKNGGKSVDISLKRSDGKYSDDYNWRSVEYKTILRKFRQLLKLTLDCVLVKELVTSPIYGVTWMRLDSLRFMKKKDIYNDFVRFVNKHNIRPDFGGSVIFKNKELHFRLLYSIIAKNFGYSGELLFVVDDVAVFSFHNDLNFRIFYGNNSRVKKIIDTLSSDNSLIVRDSTAYFTSSRS